MTFKVPSFLTNLRPNKKKLDEIYLQLSERYEGKIDPWGLNVRQHRRCFELIWPFYKYYFRAKVHNIERVQNKQYMVISNHSGQVAIDGLLIMMAFTFALRPPRILRGMVERFLPGLPFLGEIVSQTGNVLGDRKNCSYLLEKGESLLVFPEGVRGIAKNTSKFYQMQPFTSGFFRLALKNQVDILPIAVVGAEEFYPFVFHSKTLANLFGLPAFPLTPTFPLFGLLGSLPLPSPVDIYIGEPYEIPKDLSPEAPDKAINVHVHKIEQIIQDMVNNGLKNKRNYLGISRNVTKR